MTQGSVVVDDGKGVAPRQQQHDLHIFLAVDLRQVGVDLIEGVGFLAGYRVAEFRSHVGTLDYLRLRVASAQRALDAYDAALKTGRESLTRDEWNAITDAAAGSVKATGAAS